MKGNHYVTFKVVIPKKLSEEQRKAMEAYAKVEDFVMPNWYLLPLSIVYI